MQRRGFTLLEVLTVIFIFGVLVSISGYVYSSALARSRDNTRKSDLQTIKNALEQFYLDNKAYPGFDDENASFPQIFMAKWQLEKGASTLCSPIKTIFLTPSYISSVPEDPQKKLITSDGCNVLNNTTTQMGQYLYLSLPKPTSGAVVREGYYLFARVERQNNVNIIDPRTIIAKLTAASYNSGQPSFSTTVTVDGYNYFVTNINSRNN